MKGLVLAFGAFDGLHPGQLSYLRRAKRLGKTLIAVVARDASNWKPWVPYKHTEMDRVDLVGSLRFVDKAVLGGKDDALQVIRKMKPAIVAITPYHKIDGGLLQAELSALGLKTKVVVLGKHQPEKYDGFY